MVAVSILFSDIISESSIFSSDCIDNSSNALFIEFLNFWNFCFSRQFLQRNSIGDISFIIANFSKLVKDAVFNPLCLILLLYVNFLVLS